ncbi:hypothetical protein EPUL_005714, partial [Erysiphe pulchra]
MQANVGKGSNANSIALQLAHENDIDILLVQEPWVFRDLAARGSISHPNFMSFSPLSEWHTRPRALTFFRKSRGIYPYQTAIDLSSDCVQINISAGRGRRIGIWNLYNAPANCIGVGDGLKLLLELPDSPEFVGGDFNLRHPAWDSYITSTSKESTALIDRAREKDLSEAKNIIQTIHTALLASCPRSKRKGKGTAWWNKECRAASRSYCVARRLGRLGNEKRNFRNAVRRAKKEYWDSRIEKANNMSNVYKIVNWHNTAPYYQTPPLKGHSGIADVQCPPKKVALLHEVLLSRHTEATDIPQDTPTVARRTIPWYSFTEREVFRATCRVTSSSPGEDEITDPVLRLSWPIMRQLFKRAEVVILPKPGKRDRSLPKSYRPISLLSCLGKGPECLFARRFSYWATKCNILARDQCCAVSRRSATDLTTALLCDMKDALAAGKVAGIVSVDVKGAFDGVLQNRLIHRLRSQGWPVNVIGWVKSFLLDRTAKILLDQTVSDTFQILNGLPQGSPSSPILFLLFVEPVLRITKSLFGYADDITTLEIAQDLGECGFKLQASLDKTLQWGSENGIQFEITKTEVQYFHQKR